MKLSFWLLPLFTAVILQQIPLNVSNFLESHIPFSSATKFTHIIGIDIYFTSVFVFLGLIQRAAAIEIQNRLFTFIICEQCFNIFSVSPTTLF